jgi:AcrR family transcriptional regulator
VAGAARREQVTRAAIDVLAEDGFAATSFGAIAGRIGVSKGVLSYHFSSKAELLGEVVRLVLGEAEDWMTPRLRSATSYRAALRSYIDANLSFLDTHRTAIRALTEVLLNGRSVPGLAEYYAGTQGTAVEELTKLFEGGQAAGEFGDAPPRILAISLRATIDALSESLRSDPTADLAEVKQGLLTMFDRATTNADAR